MTVGGAVWMRVIPVERAAGRGGARSSTGLLFLAALDRRRQPLLKPRPAGPPDDRPLDRVSGRGGTCTGEICA
ncbi:hypothetical protein DF3PB_4010003 [uncultured Defluviicoccus sp.]|uniref:Uncharacterized protein n=1 Tax=metagenome TaxID=256318 RepID=A0A380THU5_9ZZZZ|nr:hypothetical protein DF3PB_4010003 [uncultured Defluviicoccus sp.]